jgi:hypothetical protein
LVTHPLGHLGLRQAQRLAPLGKTVPRRCLPPMSLLASSPGGCGVAPPVVALRWH